MPRARARGCSRGFAPPASGSSPPRRPIEEPSAAGGAHRWDGGVHGRDCTRITRRGQRAARNRQQAPLFPLAEEGAGQMEPDPSENHTALSPDWPVLDSTTIAGRHPHPLFVAEIEEASPQTPHLRLQLQTMRWVRPAHLVRQAPLPANGVRGHARRSSTSGVDVRKRGGGEGGGDTPSFPRGRASTAAFVAGVIYSTATSPPMRPRPQLARRWRRARARGPSNNCQLESRSD